MFLLQDCTSENLISLTRHISNSTCSYNEELCSCMSGRIEIVFFCQNEHIRLVYSCEMGRIYFVSLFQGSSDEMSYPLYDKSKEIYSYLHDRSNAMSPFFHNSSFEL